jgi:excisionase family DNA binding protein
MACQLRRPATPGAGRARGTLLLRVTQVAELLGVSRSTMYQLMGSGRVQVLRMGRIVRVTRQELGRLIGGPEPGS